MNAPFLASPVWGGKEATGRTPAQIIYPLSLEAAAATEEGNSAEQRRQVLDSKLDALMGTVRLRYLLQRQGGWDSSVEWGDVLSLGTIQGLAAA